MNHKVALVSGGSRGIGRNIAVKLAAAGYDIAIIYAGNAEAAQQTKELVRQCGADARCYACDISDYRKAEEMVKQVVAEMGTIYILVNNAGITRDKLVIQMKEDDFARVLQVNLQGAFNLIRHTYGGFVRAKCGRIINISSVVGLMGNAGQANYASAKAGLIGLTKSMAKELAGCNVTCNAIAPGMIETDMSDAIPEKAKQKLFEAIPLKRIGKPEEVADLVAFLASEQAGYITGAVIPVDGGLCM